LRAAYSRDWPGPIRQRTKQGFGAPMQSWLSHPTVAPLVQEHLIRPGCPLADLIDRSEIQRAVADRGHRAWIYLVLALWLDSRKTAGAVPDPVPNAVRIGADSPC